MFQELTNDMPYLKLALEGFAGDGKTRTAAEIAIGVHKLIHSTKPIAIYDTEQAAKALKPLFDAAGIKAMVDKSRSLASLSDAIKWCEAGNADILLIDSITHVWENYLNAYMAEKNRTRLEFQDWATIKPKWKREFSSAYVQANVHIIFTGRAGYEYETEIIKEDGKRDRKEINKSGIKMKAENETAFEPDILVLMEKVQDILGDKKRIYRIATILKDRSDKIDGLTLNADGKKPGPDFADFYPAIAALLDGAVKKYTNNELPDTFEDWESKFYMTKNARLKVISEIEGAFALMNLGTSKEDKAMKAAILKKVFGVLSIDKLEDLKLEALQHGFTTLSEYCTKYNEYMITCANDQQKPDNKHIGNMLDTIIADNDPQAQTGLLNDALANGK